MDEVNEREEEIRIGKNYGIKANLRQGTNDIIYPIEFLRKMGVFLAITIRRIITAILIIFLIFVGVSLLLTTDGLRLRFLWLPMTLLTIGLLLLLAQYSFINPSYGSFLSIGKSLDRQMKERKLVLKGKQQRDRASVVRTIEDDGTIIFEDGSLGKLLKIDGSTSLVAFPSEIRDQERRAIRYHNTRERTTTEIEITSSQKQNAEKQIKRVQHLKRINKNPAILKMLEQEESLLATRINGKKSTVIQYKLLIDKKEKGLNLALEHLYRYEAEGYYYSVIEVEKDEAEEILRDIFFLK